MAGLLSECLMAQDGLRQLPAVYSVHTYYYSTPTEDPGKQSM